MIRSKLDEILSLHKEWLETFGKKGAKANLRDANLRGADLRGANLEGADLEGADLDFSAFPLWCGSLDVHIDDRQATQLLYHLVRNIEYSQNTSKEMKELCEIKAIIEKANEFHRVDECGWIK